MNAKQWTIDNVGAEELEDQRSPCPRGKGQQFADTDESGVAEMPGQAGSTKNRTVGQIRSSCPALFL
jgi:hypothetical protein